jgi:protein phosphatase
MTALYYGHGTDIGNKSDHNEDCYFADPETGLWLIADGMGGHEAGEVASAIVSETISQAVSDSSSLVEAIQKSHTAVLSASERGIGAKGMGSTVIALKVIPSGYEIAWVGDSRAYYYPVTGCRCTASECRPRSRAIYSATKNPVMQRWIDR